jgi:hypothetical protein
MIDFCFLNVDRARGKLRSATLHSAFPAIPPPTFPLSNFPLYVTISFVSIVPFLKWKVSPEQVESLTGIRTDHGTDP